MIYFAGGEIPHLHHRRSIVGDGLSAIVIHKQQVTTVRTERALNCGLHSNTGVNVGDDLTLALRSVGAWRAKQWLALLDEIPPSALGG